jgi:hypothetical protein
VSGLRPNGSDPRLLGRIQPERRVRPIGWLGRAAGLLGRLGRARRGRESRPARPTAGFRPTRLEIKEKSFLFSKSFYNLQTNLNSIQIQILTTSTRKNKI